MNMTVKLAETRRSHRAARHQRAIHAGGWGPGAQQAAWDTTLPGWRELLQIVAHDDHADDPDRLHELADRYSALPRHLKVAWTRMLHRELIWRRSSHVPTVATLR